MSLPPNDLPPQYQVPPKKRNHWRWIIPLAIVLISSPILCCGGAIYFGWNQLNAPIDAGVAAMNANPEIVEKLGSPIEADMGFEVSNFKNSNGNGSANLSYNVSGPDGSASVSGDMKLVSGTWSPDGLKVTFEDGSSTTLD